VHAVRQSTRECTLAQRDELARRMQQLADRSADDAARADAEQRLGGAIQKRNRESFVEDDERGREALKNRVRRRRTPRLSRRTEDLRGWR
jgi:hypothetical protein